MIVQGELPPLNSPAGLHGCVKDALTYRETSEGYQSNITVADAFSLELSISEEFSSSFNGSRVEELEKAMHALSIHRRVT